MKLVLALDQGTTSSRAIVFDESGAIRASAQRELRQIFPQPGWVEHDPREIWESQLAVAREALAAVDARKVVSLGITNQRETTLVWDRKTGEPICHAIVWQDRRTADFCERLKLEGHEAEIAAKTGLVVDAYFSATKLRWILEHIPSARERAEGGELAFGTVDSWLIWKLTGGARHVTDVTNASRTQLFNIHTLSWDGELLGGFDIPRALLPEVCASSGVIGESTLGIPIGGIAGDQHAALFGQCCTRAGMAKNTFGTGCFMLMNTGATPVASTNRLLTTPGWRIGGDTSFALEGSVFIAGAAVQWLRDGLGLIKTSAEIEALAASVPDCGGIHFVPAFAGLGAPHWDSSARGVISGLTRGTTAAHLARAALDAIAYQTADVLEAMQRDFGTPLAELRVDGGAATNNYLMQFQADLLGVPVVRPQITETTALGAAFLAGLAAGVWKNEAELETQWRIDRRFEPAMNAAQRDDLRAGWNAALRRTLGN